MMILLAFSMVAFFALVSLMTLLICTCVFIPFIKKHANDIDDEELMRGLSVFPIEKN